MRVIVAGAGGYIGSRVCKTLSSMKDVEVLGLVHVHSGLASTRDVDLCRGLDVLTDVVRSFRPDAIVNSAGTTSADPSLCLQTHVIVTANLLQATAVGAPGARFVQLGSAAEYGQSVAAPNSTDEESTPLPVSAYGFSKLGSSLLARDHGGQLGLDCIVLRIFNLIGPDMRVGTIVPRVMGFLADPKTGRTDPLHTGALDVYRDFVHIDDVLAAIVSAARSRSPSGPAIVNVASGQSVLVRSLVRQILDAAGHAGPILEDEPPGGRSIGVQWQRASIQRAEKLLEWRPKLTLAMAVESLVRKR